MTARDRDGTVTIRLRVAARSRTRLRLEPWAREYELDEGATREFRFDGPPEAQLSLEVSAGEVILQGWPGAALDDAPGPASPRPSVAPRFGGLGLGDLGLGGLEHTWSRPQGLQPLSTRRRDQAIRWVAFVAAVSFLVLVVVALALARQTPH